MDENEGLQTSSSESGEIDEEELNIFTVYRSDLLIVFGSLLVICLVVIGYIWENFSDFGCTSLIIATLVFLGFAAYMYVMHLYEKLQKQQGKSDRLEKELRKEKLRSQLKSAYEASRDELMVLEVKIDKERNGTQNYMDLNQFRSSLNSIYLNVKNCESEFEAMYQQQVEKINSTDEMMQQLNVITTFNDEQGMIKKIISDLAKQFDDLKLNFGATPSGKLARMIKIQSKLIKEKNGLQIYKLPVVSTHQEKTQKLRRYELGTENLLKPHKHILLAGMTGAGKSLLVNNIINYVYGVQYKDTFRFQLVVEEEEIDERGINASKSKAESMTSWVSSFALHHQEGFCVDYSLTIIDTPGFGDTRGIKFDELIIDQLKGFFDKKEVCPIQELSAIGLVIQASQARITAEQKYLYDQALNIFGHDMRENIFLMFTFADAEAPPALEVVKSNEIPFNKDCTFKFNNSAVYAANDNESSDYSWVFGYSSLKKFFVNLETVCPTSLELTREVLKERDNLKILLGKVQENIDSGMDMLQSIEGMINDILTLKGTMKANKNYKVKSKRHPQSTKVANNSITNCISCQYTCHDPCNIKGDNKEGCASMCNGRCAVCPGKCPWDSHSNGTRIYYYDEIEVEETLQDMLQKYQIALNDKDGKKKLLLNMLDEYRSYRSRVFTDIKTASETSKRLEEIALRQSFLTNETYIERLIQSEDFNSRPNKKVRLEQLYYFKRLAKTLSQARKSPQDLTVSKYEETILKAINTIQDEIEDYRFYFPSPFGTTQTESTDIFNEKSEKGSFSPGILQVRRKDKKMKHRREILSGGSEFGDPDIGTHSTLIRMQKIEALSDSGHERKVGNGELSAVSYENRNDHSMLKSFLSMFKNE